MSKYDDVMRHLHPQVIIEKVEVPHDTARGNYTLQSSIARSHLDFEHTLINYMDHHMRAVVGSSLPPEFLLERARSYLSSGGSNFDNFVFVGMSGTGGGMVAVLNAVAEGFKEQMRRAYFDFVTDSYIDPLSFAEVVEVMSSLKNRLGGFSPQPFAYLEPEAMAADYKNILWQYIESLSTYRNVWQY